MSELKVIQPTIISMKHEYRSEYSYSITHVNFAVGEISWEMEYNHKDNVIGLKKYTNNSVYESFLKTMAAINIEVDINCHNDFIKSEYAIYEKDYLAKKKEQAQKEQIKRQSLMAALKEQLYFIFPNYEVIVNYEDSFTLRYHTIEITVCRMKHLNKTTRCNEYKWEVDTREWQGSRHIKRGHKRSNNDISKLKVEIDSYLLYKYNELQEKKKTIEYVQNFDKLMAEKGWMPAGKEEYIDKYHTFIRTSNNGTMYSKDNIVINISHKDTPIITNIHKNVNIPIENIETLNNQGI